MSCFFTGIEWWMRKTWIHFDYISHRQLCFAGSSIIFISLPSLLSWWYFPFDEIFCGHFHRSWHADQLASRPFVPQMTGPIVHNNRAPLVSDSVNITTSCTVNWTYKQQQLLFAAVTLHAAVAETHFRVQMKSPNQSLCPISRSKMLPHSFAPWSCFDFLLAAGKCNHIQLFHPQLC